MAIKTFLAMTAAEIHAAPTLPNQMAWMACHFSPYGRSISNLPGNLPAGSLLILNDRIPIQGHDPEQICFQLEELLSRFSCCGLLLDFQRENCPETAELVRHLSRELTCPLTVSQGYGADTHAGLLLPPLPHHIPLAEYVPQGQGRDLWLELAQDGERITVTEKGASISPLPAFDFPGTGHPEELLHCHYRVEENQDSVEFSLWRTTEDLRDLLREAEDLGISNAVGLYQELGCFL